MSIPGCPFCDKKGLPIIPVRYAIAPNESCLPALPASLAGNSTSIDLGGAAKYTLRSLRNGYLYVYDEARTHWDGYFVVGTGYYAKLNLNQPTPPLDRAKFTCDPSTDGLIASCITIPTPKQATKVWVGFSEVEWTPAVLKQHEDASIRARHMRCLNVAQWLGSHQQAHAAKITELDQLVADYALDDQAGKGFAWSPFNFVSKKLNAQRTKAAAERLSPGNGLILALDDPSGIAQEITRFMQAKTQVFLNDPVRARPLAVSGAIMALKEAIQKQAENDEIQAADQLVDQLEGDAAIAITFNSKTYDQYESLRKVTPEQSKRAKDDAWAKYNNSYDENKRLEFVKQYDKDLSAFDKSVILPLARAHVKWLTSDFTNYYFTCNFDPLSLLTGFAFEKVFTLCIENTADKQPCVDQYQTWLNGEVTDRKNLLLRGLTLNNDELAKKVKDATAQSAQPKDIPWDQLIDGYKKSVESVAEIAGSTLAQKLAAADNMSRLAYQLGGPIASFLGKTIDGAAVSKPGIAVLATLGMRIQKPIVTLTITGSKAKFREALIRQLMLAQDAKFSDNQIRKAVSDEMKRLQVEGISDQGTTRKTWLLVIDKEHLEGLPQKVSAMSRQQAAQYVAKALVTPEQLEAATKIRFREIVDSDVRFGVVTLICNLYSLKNAVADSSDAMLHEKGEAVKKLRASVGAVAGTGAEMLGKVLERMPWGRTLLAQGVEFRPLAQLTRGLAISIAGRAVGAAAGFVLAAIDAVHFADEAGEGHTGMAALYGLSSILGATLAVGLLFAWSGPIMILIIGVFVLVQVLIAVFKDNKLQEWLKRCYWGDSKECYLSPQVESDELAKALKG